MIRIGEEESPSHSLLLVHGGGSGAYQMKPLAQRLIEGDSRLSIWIPDLAGYGDEPGRTEDPIAGHTAVLARAGQEMGRPFFVLGHSMGGFLALQLALHLGPRILGVIGVEPMALGVLDEVEDRDAIEQDREVIRRMTATIEASDEEVEDGFAGFIEYWNQTAWNEIPIPIRERLNRKSRQIGAEARAISSDRTPGSAYAMLGPVHLMCGEESPLPARRIVTRLAQSIEQSSLEWVQAARHMSLLSQPDLYVAGILSFIHRVSGRTLTIHGVPGGSGERSSG